MMTHGFSAREAAFLRRLTPEWRIQKFLDEIEYDGRRRRLPIAAPRTARTDRAVPRRCAVRRRRVAAAGTPAVAHGSRSRSRRRSRRGDLFSATAIGARSPARTTRAAFSRTGLPDTAGAGAVVLRIVLHLRREKTLRRYSVPSTCRASTIASG